MEITNLRSGELLSAAEECELADRIAAGVYAGELLSTGGRPGVSEAELLQLIRLGQESWDRFLLANLRLVAMVSRATARATGHPEPDLFQEGCAAMAHALRRFDQRQGRFATYALPWIRSTIARAVHRQQHGAGATEQDRCRRVRRSWWLLAQRLRREPTAAEVARELDEDPADVARALHRDGTVLQLEDGPWGDPPDPGAQERLATVLQHRVPVDEWMASLPGIEARVIGLRFGFDGHERGYAETGRVLQLQAGRVRRLEARALDRLRDLCHTDDLPMVG